MNYRLLFIFLFLLPYVGKAQKQISDSSYVAIDHRVITFQFDSLQFYSDIMPVDSLAKYYAVSPTRLIDPANFALTLSAGRLSYDDFTFLLTRDSVRRIIREKNTYRTLGQGQDAYLAMIPTSKNQKTLYDALRYTNSAYFLTLNLYEVLALDTTYSWGDDVLHVIHYELFDKDFNLIKGGKYEAIDYVIDPREMLWFWNDFLIDLSLWIKANEQVKGEEADNIGEAYQKQREEFIDKKFGLKKKAMFSIDIGLNMPYAGIGFGYTKMLSEYLALDMGVGFDYQGLKTAIGSYYYLNGFKNNRPMAGVYLSYATGNTFRLGEEYDALGNLISFSEYRVLSDWALHGRFGWSFIFEDVIVTPSIGYAFPFKREQTIILQDQGERFNNNFASGMAVGGWEGGISFKIFLD